MHVYEFVICFSPLLFFFLFLWHFQKAKEFVSVPEFDFVLNILEKWLKEKDRLYPALYLRLELGMSS